MNQAAVPVIVAGKPLNTPAKNPLAVPTQKLADAIAQEWRNCHPAFIAGSPSNKNQTPQQVRGDSSKMPLTSIAATAIDRVAGQKDAIAQVLLVYVDTDTLSYRSPSPLEGEGGVGGLSPHIRQSNALHHSPHPNPPPNGEGISLAQLQQQQWDPVLTRLSKELGVAWETTTGVMPVDQSPKLHQAIGKYLLSLNDMQLSAACVLSSGLSSLALALAVLMRHIDAAEAFRLSRLEEEFQAARWGRDEEAGERAGRIREEMLAAGRFLDLLQSF